jgi:putative membrane protein
MAGPVVWTPYCGIAPEPAEWLVRWNGDPILIGLILLAGIVAVRRAGDGRQRSLALAAAAVALLLFVSPFCALTSALFAARSAHHVLLIAALAPLVAAALPRRRLAGLPGGLFAWTAASAAILWLWHVPALYAGALSRDSLYWMMQASLAGPAIGFWTALRRAARGPAVVALFAYSVQMSLLGGWLTFSSTAFYAPHTLTTGAWGLTPLADQQLAGLVMWVPGGLAYLAAALVLARGLVGETSRTLPA